MSVEIEIVKPEVVDILRSLEKLGLIRVVGAEPKSSNELKEDTAEYGLEQKRAAASESELSAWLDDLRARFEGANISEEDINREVEAVRKKRYGR